MSAVDWSSAPAPWNFLGPEIARQLHEDCAFPSKEALIKRRALCQPATCKRGTICWVLNGAAAFGTINDGKKNHLFQCLGCLERIVFDGKPGSPPGKWRTS